MQLTRKELYDLVWSEAMTTICKRFGLSDNGLRKHCKSMNIPTPSLGYWAKLQHGKKVERIPLPEDFNGKKKIVSLREVDPKDIVVEIDKPIDPQKLREQEIRQGDISSFTAADILYAKDPLIIDTKESLRVDRDNETDYLKKNPYKSKIKEVLDLYVDAKSVDRALCIYWAVIKGLRSRGHDIKIRKHETFALINGEEIKINLCERRKKDMESAAFKTDFCGELLFNIYTWGTNKYTYQDTAHTRLEDKIISIIACLELQAVTIKEERIEEERRRIREEEKERHRQIYQAKKEKELERFQSLFTMADRHFKANIIRQYVHSYEEQLRTRSITDEEILAELAWAKDKADWLDPLISKPDEYLDHYNKDTITQSKNSYSSSYNPPSQHAEYNPWAKPWWRK